MNGDDGPTVTSQYNRDEKLGRYNTAMGLTFKRTFSVKRWIDVFCCSTGRFHICKFYVIFFMNWNVFCQRFWDANVLFEKKKNDDWLIEKSNTFIPLQVFVQRLNLTNTNTERPLKWKVWVHLFTSKHIHFIYKM